MRVRVKHLLPAGDMPKDFDSFGEAEMDVPVDATLADIMGQIELPQEESYIALVHGQPVVPDDRAGHAISGGGELTLLPAIRGGQGL